MFCVCAPKSNSQESEKEHNDRKNRIKSVMTAIKEAYSAHDRRTSTHYCWPHTIMPSFLSAGLIKILKPQRGVNGYFATRFGALTSCRNSHSGTYISDVCEMLFIIANGCRFSKKIETTTVNADCNIERKTNVILSTWLRLRGGQMRLQCMLVLALICLAHVSCAFRAKTLFIGKGENITSADIDDQPILVFLEASLNHSVTYRSCSPGASSSAASNADLIVVSSTCNATYVRNDMSWIAASPLGVLTWNFGFTDEKAGNLGLNRNYGQYRSSDVLVLPDSPQHAVTASIGEPGTLSILFISPEDMAEYYNLAPDVRPLTGGKNSGRYGVMVAEVDGALCFS